MAKEETVTKIELVTIELEEDVLTGLRQTNDRLNQLVSNVGSIHIRQRELEDELEKLGETLTNTEEQFKETNKQMRESLADLEKEYPRGQIDLDQGTLTYNPEIKKQQEQQSQ